MFEQSLQLFLSLSDDFFCRRVIKEDEKAGWSVGLVGCVFVQMHAMLKFRNAVVESRTLLNQTKKAQTLTVGAC